MLGYRYTLKNSSSWKGRAKKYPVVGVFISPDWISCPSTPNIRRKAQLCGPGRGKSNMILDEDQTGRCCGFD